MEEDNDYSVTNQEQNNNQIAKFLRENYTLIEEDKVRMIEENKEVPAENLGFFSSILKYGWKPTTIDLLRNTETHILKTALKTPFEQYYVDVGGHRINTIKMGSGTPLVMAHGFGGGIGIWIGNLDILSKHFTIYALDILGWGRSSRPIFPGNTPEEAEIWFLEGLELWINALNLDTFILLGHSFGAYLSAIYTLKHPKKVSRLILADPWGVPQKTEDAPRNTTLRGQAIHLAANVVTSPFSILRALGPIGPSLIDRFRPDLKMKFSQFITDPNIMSSYIYHCNAQTPSGESAFWHLHIPFGWAKLPLEKRLHQISPDIPITAIYGQDTWMDINSLYKLLPFLQSRTELVLLPDAGHHVYIDSSTLFNLAVIATKYDSIPQFITEQKLRGWYNYKQ
jgi:pimeloyl-ACP methyl ester carboxylesterase